MIDLAHLIWSHHEGRNSEGEKFNFDSLTHGSGRILAKIFGPSGGDEFAYRVSFYFTASKKILPNPNEAFDFMYLDAAKIFAESVVCRSTPECLPGTIRRRPKASKVTEKASA